MMYTIVQQFIKRANSEIVKLIILIFNSENINVISY